MGRGTRQVWLRFHPEPWDTETEQEYHKRFTGAIERWLDAGHGSCVLRQNECASIVDDALRHFDGNRLALISSVVMPNHVHALFDSESNTSVGRFTSQLENRSVHGPSIDWSGARELYGKEATSIVSCGTKNIFEIVSATSGVIQRRHI